MTTRYMSALEVEVEDLFPARKRDLAEMSEALDNSEDLLSEKELECTLLRALLTEKRREAQKHVDALEVILDDGAYYLGRKQLEQLPYLQAQMELLAADMRKGL